MTVKTKLNIGDICYFMINSKVLSSKVKTIDIYISDDSIRTRYWITENPAGSRYSNCFEDENIFATKELLLQSL